MSIGVPSSNPDRREPINVTRQLLRGSLWMVAIRWAFRGIGIANTVVLARLLTPEDFGIIAMAMLVVGTLEVVSDSGVQLVLIRHLAPQREHYDTAWTIGILTGAALAGAILALAPFTVYYFHEPRAVTVIQCLAIRAFVSGFENPGTADFRRNLNFARHFQINVYQKLATVILGISCAIILRDYWALVVAMIGSRVIGVWLSFAMQPFRPRLSLSKTREIWSFSLWVLAANVGSYFSTRVDELVVGGIASASQMGRYSVAADMAAAPIMEIAFPATHAQFPVLARVQQDSAVLCRSFLGLFSALAVLCIAVGVGVSLVADDFASVVLGAQWAGISPLIVWLAMEAAVFHTANPTSIFFQVTGRPQLSAQLAWLRFGLLGLVLAVASRSGDLERIAEGRLAVTLVLTPFSFVILGRLYPVSLRQIFDALWRPLIAAVGMALAVLAVEAALRGQSPFVRLVMAIMTGGPAFALSLIAAWILSGRPSGVEATVLNAVAWRARHAHAILSGIRR